MSEYQRGHIVPPRVTMRQACPIGLVARRGCALTDTQTALASRPPEWPSAEDLASLDERNGLEGTIDDRCESDFFDTREEQ